MRIVKAASYAIILMGILLLFFLCSPSIGSRPTHHVPAILNLPATKESPYSKDIVAQSEYWKHIHAGTNFFRGEESDFAEQEIRLAIEKSRSAGDVWMARRMLGRIYEQKKLFDMALKENEWLYENNPREDVRQTLLGEKNSLLKKIHTANVVKSNS